MTTVTSGDGVMVRAPGADQKVHREPVRAADHPAVDRLERESDRVYGDVQGGENRASKRARYHACGQALLDAREQRAGDRRPRDAPTAVLDDRDVIPALEHPPQARL